VLWAAGNQVSPLIKTLGIETDKSGRAKVNEDLTIGDHDNIFVIGDAAAVESAGKEGSSERVEYLPAIAPVAMQQGRHVAKIIKLNLKDKSRRKFKYNDRGTMATIGKAKAVALIKGFKFSGFIAWLLWSVVHVLFLISFRNRLRVMAEWFWYYLTNRPGIRLIVKEDRGNNLSQLRN
jgi:NADH dehydrogenase